MQEAYEKALDRASIHCNDIGSDDVLMRTKGVVALMLEIEPYAPEDIVSSLTQVLTMVVSRPELWQMEESPIVSIVRLTLGKIRLIEQSRLLSEQTREAMAKAGVLLSALEEDDVN